jgi:hypothetical protein
MILHCRLNSEGWQRRKILASGQAKTKRQKTVAVKSRLAGQGVCILVQKLYLYR